MAKQNQQASSRSKVRLLFVEGDFSPGDLRELAQALSNAVKPVQLVSRPGVLGRPATATEVQGDGGDQEVRARLVHRIGNLALLTRKKNRDAWNWDFERKKDSYFRRNGISPFVLTTQVLDEPEWLPSVVNARQLKLMGVFESHWRLAKRMSVADWAIKNI